MRTWTREEIKKAFDNIYKMEAPKGERQIKLQVWCPNEEAAEKFFKEFHQMFKDELEKMAGSPVFK